MDFTSQQEARLGARKSMTTLLEGESPVLRQEELSQAMRRRSANINLQKSMKLLDETVATPSFLRKTPKVLKHSAYTPRHMPSGSKFDVSAIGLGTPGASLIATPSMRPIYDESGVDNSFYNSPRKSGMFKESTIMEQDEVLTTNVALLQDDPTVTAHTGMYEDFKQFTQQLSSHKQLFELLPHYEQVCGDNVALLRRLMKNTVPGQQKFVKTMDLCRSINCEKKTWRLITSLYRDRLSSETQDESMVTDNMSIPNSEKEIITALYERETSVRQAQLVIDWLEKNSEEELEDCYDNVEFFTDSTGAWENTLHCLKNKANFSTTSTYESQRAMVTELDPDAPIRQRRPLHDLDMEDEVRLLKHMFAYIRAGQLDEAQKLCNKVGHYWRAATLEGWRLCHDPNYNGETIGQSLEGNHYRDVWKGVCWTMAEEEELHSYERGLYAAYSGHLKQLLHVCDTWEDHVWAYTRSMVDVRVEQELRVNHTLGREWAALPQAYWQKMLNMETIFEEIQASPNDRVRMESAERHRVIQKYIILNDINGLAEDMAEWSRDEVHPPDPLLLRFMAHLVLFFRKIGVQVKDQYNECVLEAYVSELVCQRQLPLVAFYVSALQKQHQVHNYAAFLEGIHGREERVACLSYAEECGLDVASITKCVVERIRLKETTEFDGTAELNTEVSTNADDELKISAIDWLVFDPSQRAEAMKQANALMRTFVAAQKLPAAREVFNKIPLDSIDIVISNCQQQTGSMSLLAEHDNAIREYLCMKAYLDAHDSFNDWFQHYHHSKPTEPVNPVGANFTERVAHEHRQKQYEAELERWQHTLGLQTKMTKEKIYNVLLFVDGGWMIDLREDENWVDEQRVHQMKLLRQLCLPPLCFLLHTMLHTTEQYKECLQLADLICSEQYRLYTVFRRDERQKLLQKLRESSVKLLDKNLDPLGYPLS